MTTARPRPDTSWIAVVPSADHRAVRAPFFDGTQVCATTDPELWFNGSSVARRLCRECPFMVECLEYALPKTWLLGTWGGTSRHDRKRIRAKRGDVEITPPDWDYGG